MIIIMIIYYKGNRYQRWDLNMGLPDCKSSTIPAISWCFSKAEEAKRTFLGYLLP